MLTFEVLRGFKLCSFKRLKTLWCPPWFYLNNFTKWRSVYEIQYFNWFTINSFDALSANLTKWSNTLKQFRRIVWVCLIILRDWPKMIKHIKGLILQNSLIFFLKTIQNNNELWILILNLKIELLQISVKVVCKLSFYCFYNRFFETVSILFESAVLEILGNLYRDSAIRGLLWKKVSQKFHKIQRKTPVPVSFLIKLQGSGLQLY